MLRKFLLAASCIALTTVSAYEPQRWPVLVELFTSEGCSSCPPADRQLQELDHQVIVLSEHVDYWDHQGWKDRFSSPVFTQRQEWYAHAFGIDSPYTPQMVVDGVAQFTGGDARRAMTEINRASDSPKATIVIERTEKGARVDAENSPRDADVWLAVADESDATHVTAGENKGRTLPHASVVRSLRKIGTIRRGGTFSRAVDLELGSGNKRLVVFLQAVGQTRIVGAQILPAPEI
jgi:hypothetical protein